MPKLVESVVEADCTLLVSKHQGDLCPFPLADGVLEALSKYKAPLSLSSLFAFCVVVVVVMACLDAALEALSKYKLFTLQSSSSLSLLALSAAVSSKLFWFVPSSPRTSQLRLRLLVGF